MKLALLKSQSVTFASRNRERWFRVLAIIGVPLFLLIALEGLLRLTGYGFPTAFFLEHQIEDRSVLVPNYQFGKRFFPPGLVRYPRPVPIAARKPAGTLRIFVLGESAAMGDPDSRFGLPRMLEVLLRERFPEQPFEVVNAAMVAINSHVVRSIARECAQREGDLWVIYMGNNEVIGPFGSMSIFGSQTPPLSWIRAGLAFKTTQLGQFMDSAVLSLSANAGAPAEWGGMTMWAEQQIQEDPARRTGVYSHFQSNLADILEAGRRADVPILLCTVATNLKDCAPFGSRHRSDLTASELAQWDAAYSEGVALEAQGKFAEAGPSFERAGKIDGHFADLSFRRARCSLAAGNFTDALRFFHAARDQDALQFRADGRINGMIRQSAGAYANLGVRLLDAEHLFASNSPNGLVGDDYFLEHVHLNPEGNYLLARAVAEQITEQLSLDSRTRTATLEPKTPDMSASADAAATSARLPDWLSQEECWQALGFVDSNRHDLWKEILGRLEQPPFTGQIDHEQRVQATRERLNRFRSAIKPAQVRLAVQHVERTLARRPDDADLRSNLAQLLDISGNVSGAEEQWRAVIRLRPQAHLPCYNLGKLLEIQGRDAEARQYYERSLEILPEYFEARHAMGQILARQGRNVEAARELQKAVRQSPRSVPARMALALALAAANQPAKAEQQFREVLRLDPENPPARNYIESRSRR